VTPTSYILATAGHVDHGKSALVRALAGTGPDRLPEEKARGITIDLGFANLLLPGPDGAAFSVGIIDVPGHEDFVKNMIAGVGSIDMALLVVAADDGWMPQTEEHLQILTHLGVRRGVVALTKADLAANLQRALSDLRERLRETPLAEALIVPTSVVTGRGLTELRDAIALTLAITPPPRDIGKPRLAVDRAFSLKGVGTVVTGTLSGGRLHRGQEVILQPGGVRSRIRSMQSHGRSQEEVCPGSRVALNLADVSVAGSSAGPRGEKTAGRGDVVTTEAVVGQGAAARTLDVLLERTARPAWPGALRSGTTVRVHHGSDSCAARVRLLESAELARGASGLARLTLSSPSMILVGDRLVIRDGSAKFTLAGGVVLDVDAPRSRRGRGAQRAMLRERAASQESARVYVASQLSRDQAVAASALLVRSRFAQTEVMAAVTETVRSGHAVAAGGLLVSTDAWREFLASAASLVDEHHRAHPEEAGIAVAAVKQDLGPRGVPPALADAIVGVMAADGFVRQGPLLRRTSHRPALPPRLRPAGERLRHLLAGRGFDAAARKELAGGGDLADQALRFLIAGGEAVELGQGLVLGVEAFNRAVDQVRRHLAVRGPATVSELKSLLGSSRRVMVPFVERLDRDGVTRRQGDLRVLRDGRASSD
jgi:selenocysteine-specific elongation factor